MATSRVVSTSFWKDSYVIDLDPTEKLLFLYFLTNPRTTIAGIYEISLREVAFDTGIDKDMVAKILQRFCNDGKMYFEKNWLILNNFIKHQRPNPSVIKGIDRAIDDLPQWLKDIIDVQTDTENKQLNIFVHSESVKPVDKDRLGTDWVQTGTPNLTKPNLIKPNLTKLKAAADKRQQPGSNKFDEDKKPQPGLDKKAYAMAVRADEEQAARVHGSQDRKPSGIESARQVADRIKHKAIK